MPAECGRGRRERGNASRIAARGMALGWLALCLTGGPDLSAMPPSATPGGTTAAPPATQPPPSQPPAVQPPAVAWPPVSPQPAVDPMRTAAPSLRFFGAESGLSGQINDIALDSTGVLWLGTADGLARYDGRGFSFLRSAPGAPDGLPDNAIAALHVDARDRVWVATWAGLVRYDPVPGRFAALPDSPGARDCGDDLAALAGAPLTAQDPYLWTVSNDGRLCVLDADGRARRLQTPDGQAPVPEHFQPGVIVLERADTALIAGIEGVLRVRIGRDGHARVEPVLGSQATQLARDADGTVWIGGDDGLWRMPAAGRPAPAQIALPDRGRHALVRQLRNGDMWVAQPAAAHRLRGGTRSLLEALGGVYTLIEDREGGLWFVTFDRGLAYLPPDHARFATLRLAGLDPLDTTVDAAGTAWLLGRRSVHRLGAVDGDLSLLPAQGLPLDRLGVRQPVSLASCDGALWVVDESGVVRYTPATGAHRRVIDRARDTMALPVALMCDVDGRLWLALNGGGIDVHARDGRLLFSIPPEQVYGARAADFVDPVRGPDGRFWALVPDAVLRWDGRRLRRLPLAEGEDAHAMAFAADGTLWVARFGALERYRHDGKALQRVRRIDGDDGLPALEVRGLIASGDSGVWATTLRGLLQVDARLGRVRLYTMQDGLPDIDFTMNAPQRAGSRAGKAVALSPGGLVRFDPDAALPDALPSPLHWSGLRLRRGEDDVGVDPAQPLRLQPGDRDLRVGVRLATFSAPAQHRYAFRLDGYDPDWVHQDGDRHADAGERVFSQLAPGRYTLEVRGRNAVGAWSTPLRLPIEVLPPWWRTGWAMSLAMLIFAAAVLALALAHRRRLLRRHSYQLARQRRDLAEEASLAKSRFLADLGHELRTPMTGVLGMAELLHHSPLDGAQRGRVQAIRRAGEHLMRLLDEALDLARIEAGRVQLQHAPFSLRAVLAEVQALIAAQAEAKGLRFVLHIAPDTADARIGDAQRLRQVLLNLLGNAVKFTARGEVALEVAPVRMPEHAHTPEDARSRMHMHAQSQSQSQTHAHIDGLRLHVRDTGPGMTAEQCARLFRRFEQAEGARTAARYGGTGLGLAISRELVQAMGGEIAVDSAPGVGTDFMVRLALEIDSSAAFTAGSGGDDAALQVASPAVPSADAGAAGDAGPHAATAEGMSAHGMSAEARAAQSKAAEGKTATCSLDSERKTALPALRVLLVEDDPTVAEVVAGLLRLRGHRVVHAAHGLAALMDVAAMQATGAAFDLALIDLDLPGIDGCTLAAQLRASGFTAPILAITARADSDAEPQARAAGFDAFLRKPLSGDGLAEAMTSLIGENP